MINAFKRKKQPDVVRRALMDSAVHIAANYGLSAVTVQRVSDAAGVTKGGFLHHFASKQTLIDAIFAEMMGDLDREVDASIATDPEPYGSFTRAYVDAVINMVWEGNTNPRGSLSIVMFADPQLSDLWADWFNERLRRHSDTDGDVALAVVRMAVDGMWIGDHARIDLPPRGALMEHLTAMTYPEAKKKITD